MTDNTTHDLSAMIDCLPDAPFKQRLSAAVEKLIADRDSKDLNWQSACKREIALLDERDALRSAAQMAIESIDELTYSNSTQAAYAKTYAAKMAIRKALK